MTIRNEVVKGGWRPNKTDVARAATVIAFSTIGDIELYLNKGFILVLSYWERSACMGT